MDEGASKRRSKSSSSSLTALEAASAGRLVDALDDVDRAIVDALRADSRMSVRALAEQLHISRAGAYARIDRLRERGVITGFTISVDPAKAGLTTTAYVAINMEQNAWRAVSEKLVALPFVDRVSLMGSEFDVLALVHAPDNTALRTLVLEHIQAIPGVVGTRTWLVFDELRGAGSVGTS